MESMKRNRGITLISLIITIIILLILAGIAISQLNENGLFEKAKMSSEEYAKKSAKEKLEITLANLIIDKQTNSQYNQDEYINTKLRNEGFEVNGDIVTVEKYKFKIDRDNLKIIEDVEDDDISDFEKLQKSYVQEGLVCWYDGKYNTKSGHNQNTDVWEDLSGNNNGILKNINNTDKSGWTNNSLILDGIDDWVQMKKVNGTDNGITIEVVARTVSIDLEKIQIYMANLENGGIAIYKNTDNKNVSEIYINNEYNKLSSDKIVKNNQIYSMSAGYISNEYFFSEDGQIYKKEGDFKYKEPEKDTIFALGTNPSGQESSLSSKGSYANIEIYSVRIYNRGLSEEEIKQNYKSDSERFNIETKQENSTLGYVSDGLKVLYDGEYNTPVSAHYNSTKTWYDLSGNGNDGILSNINYDSNSGWTNNSVKLDGVDDYVKIGKIDAQNNCITVEIVSKIISNQTGKAQYFITNLETGGIGLRKETTNVNGVIAYIGGGYKYIKSNNEVLNNKMYSLSTKYDGENYCLRQNDVTYSEKIVGDYKNPEKNTIFMIGGNPDGNSMSNTNPLFNIEVYSVRIYDRALTNDEINQNYENDKVRFGIDD